MDFHSTAARFTYATRTASADWLKFATDMLSVDGKDCADIGCGGGIYSRALSALGAHSVVGVDSSKKILNGAIEKTNDSVVEYREGDAVNLPLVSASKDLVLGRAVIHHLEQPEEFFAEAFRVLRPNGMLVIQDRTKEDCLQPATVEHFRGYLFQLFPRLLEYEAARRPDSNTVVQALESSGFSQIKKVELWELRKIYDAPQDLEEDLIQRTGRSILYQLTDGELFKLVAFVLDKAENHFPLKEKDLWTLWIATK